MNSDISVTTKLVIYVECDVCKVAEPFWFLISITLNWMARMACHIFNGPEDL